MLLEVGNKEWNLNGFKGKMIINSFGNRVVDNFEIVFLLGF